MMIVAFQIDPSRRITRDCRPARMLASTSPAAWAATIPADSAPGWWRYGAAGRSGNVGQFAADGVDHSEPVSGARQRSETDCNGQAWRQRSGRELRFGRN